MRHALSTLRKIQQGMQKVLAKLPANSSLFWKGQLKEKRKNQQQKKKFKIFQSSSMQSTSQPILYDWLSSYLLSQEAITIKTLSSCTLFSRGITCSNHVSPVFPSS